MPVGHVCIRAVAAGRGRQITVDCPHAGGIFTVMWRSTSECHQWTCAYHREAAKRPSGEQQIKRQEADKLWLVVQLQFTGRRWTMLAMQRWTVELRLQDPEAARQKGARLAQMAVRRHQRQIKAPDRAERLARSNAVVMRRAAQSLIRGHGPQPDGGWAEVASEAAVLCFDEVQITDPFTAIALKGMIQEALR